MRVIYLVRAFQLIAALYSLWLLYSVHEFCERTAHPMSYCPALKGIPLATPEQIEEHLRIKHQRAANHRFHTVTETTFDHSPTTTTIHEATAGESSTVTSEEAAKSRKRREERRELPGNGMSDAEDLPHEKSKPAAAPAVAEAAAPVAPAAGTEAPAAAAAAA
ncbi:hypothetical protein PFISCL1PPCAC_21581, partial [Pristionchus fissidentatus]